MYMQKNPIWLYPDDILVLKVMELFWLWILSLYYHAPLDNGSRKRFIEMCQFHRLEILFPGYEEDFKQLVLGLEVKIDLDNWMA